MQTNRRFLVYAGIFLMMALCYVDRINLSVAAKSIAATYGLSPVQLGYVFSSFLWTYIIFLLPLGIAVDRWGARAVTAGSLFIWSIAGAFTGLAGSFSGLFAARLALGIGEAASYPAGGRVIREWAPESERGIAAAVLNSGAYAGLAIGAPLVGWLVANFGWRESFYVTGVAGIVLAILWYLIYRTPEQASWLDQAERTRILNERGDIATEGQPRLKSADLGTLFQSVSMWGLGLTQGFAGYTLFLFLTWLPTYLSDTRGLDVMRSGALAAVPYAAAVPFGQLMGFVSDRFLRRRGTKQGARRYMIAAALLVSSVILLTPFVSNIVLLMVIFSISLTCVSTAMGMNIALTNDLLEDGTQAGSATGLLVLGGSILSTLAPIVTGYAVASPLGYEGAFVVAGVLLLAGVASVLLMTRQPIGTKPALHFAATEAERAQSAGSW